MFVRLLGENHNEMLQMSKSDWKPSGDGEALRQESAIEDESEPGGFQTCWVDLSSVSKNGGEAVSQDFETLQGFIERVLRKHPSARGSYKLLVSYSWFYQTGHRGFIEFSPRQLQLMSSTEAITRTARRIYKEIPGLAPSAEIQEKRATLQEDYRERYR